jgi:hypothetical protein
VTVCVAAMCGGNIIFGASDRMLTARDVEFEPPNAKIIGLTTSIAIMWAGDSGLQAEILASVISDVYDRIRAEPNNWWAVRDVAHLYRRYFNEARLRRSETTVLAPLGLDRSTYISEQRKLSPSLARSLADKLIYFDMPGVEAIFAGVDTTGPAPPNAHIYVARGAEITCHDMIGFAAIGVGMRHASSQMMFAGHTGNAELPETLLLTYRAKKRAEVAPGVGEDTDMFAVGPGLGTYTTIDPPILRDIDQIYKRSVAVAAKGDERAKVHMKGFLDELAKRAAASDQQPPAPPAPPAPESPAPEAPAPPALPAGGEE